MSICSSVQNLLDRGKVRRPPNAHADSVPTIVTALAKCVVPVGLRLREFALFAFQLSKDQSRRAAEHQIRKYSRRMDRPPGEVHFPLILLGKLNHGSLEGLLCDYCLSVFDLGFAGHF